MKMKKLFLIPLLLTTAALTGCGGGEKKPTKNVNSVSDVMKNLEDGHYYVYHKDSQQVEEVYFGNANFDYGDASANASANRVMWFKDDYSKIPTLALGKNDELIFYSQEEFSPEFDFERFYDYGYSFGLCGITITPSGRCAVSTDPQDMCTYPGGDTDQILRIENEMVVIDSINEVPLRIPEKDQNPSYEKFYANSFQSGQLVHLTPSGTLAGLIKDRNYPVEVYAGTTLPSTMYFNADVRIMGSYEGFASTEYSYNKDSNYISIAIPSNFNDGYYNINGAGLFRLVHGNAYAGDESNTDMNAPNAVLDQNGNVSDTSQTDPTQVPEANAVQSGGGQVDYDPVNNTINGYPMGTPDSLYPFTINEAGEVSIRITFKMQSGYSVTEGNAGLPDVVAVLQASDGSNYQFSQEYNAAGEQTLYLKQFINQSGDNEICFYSLAGREYDVQFLE